MVKLLHSSVNHPKTFVTDYIFQNLAGSHEVPCKQHAVQCQMQENQKVLLKHMLRKKLTSWWWFCCNNNNNNRTKVWEQVLTGNKPCKEDCKVTKSKIIIKISHVCTISYSIAYQLLLNHTEVVSLPALAGIFVMRMRCQNAKACPRRENSQPGFIARLS